MFETLEYLNIKNIGAEVVFWSGVILAIGIFHLRVVRPFLRTVNRVSEVIPTLVEMADHYKNEGPTKINERFDTINERISELTFKTDLLMSVTLQTATSSPITTPILLSVPEKKNRRHGDHAPVSELGEE